MHIVDLTPDHPAYIEQIAAILVAAFREHWPEAWPNIEAARAEVRESFAPDRLSLVALDDADKVLGWVGAIDTYDGNAWELHPLAVHPDHQGGGVGRALVQELEARLRERGAHTIYLGSDDEDAMTTLAGVDLYDNLHQRIANIQNLRRHPYQFYQKLGFIIVGVIPDANGPGKPDILMAKRVSRLIPNIAGNAIGANIHASC